MMGYDVKGIIINIVDLNMIGQCMTLVSGQIEA